MRNKLPGQTMIAVEEHELARLREIAGYFREGDWTRLGNLNEYIQYDHRDLFREEIDAIQRLQKAAKLAQDGA